MSTVSPGDARHALVAAATFILVAMATAGWGVVFSSSNGELREEIEAKGQVRAVLERQASAKAGAGPGAAASALRGVAAVSAPTETTAASRLQKRLLERLEAAGGSVQSVQAEPVKDPANDGLRKLAAQLTFDSTIGGLQQLLFDLETGVPFVFVDALTVQPATTSTPGTRVGDKLRVILGVSSYWKQE